MSFNTPIVFFIFKRTEKSVQIMNQIARVKPRKLYIIADEGRNDEEKKLAAQCREAVEECVTWDCELIKNYAVENKGCFDRIGLGALWVFSQESQAIFLEDDNFPEETFFPYCEEMLSRYKNDDRVMWVCGTNYLEDYHCENGASYVFTRHMHPCGWASWSEKFIKYYDAYFENFTSQNLKKIKSEYTNQKLYKNDLKHWKIERVNKEKQGRYCSWDYQMCFSLRYFNKVGIVPCKNQIRNIGVDNFSIHGGSSFDNIMTQRFCGMDSLPMKFPMIHPEKVEIDDTFEALVDEIVIVPVDYKRKIKRLIPNLVRLILRVPAGVTTRQFLKIRK